MVSLDQTCQFVLASTIDGINPACVVVLKVTRKAVTFMLNQAPATLTDLRKASDQAFLDRFVGSLSVRSLTDWERGDCSDPDHALETEDNLVLAKTRATTF